MMTTQALDLPRIEFLLAAGVDSSPHLRSLVARLIAREADEAKKRLERSWLGGLTLEEANEQWARRP